MMAKVVCADHLPEQACLMGRLAMNTLGSSISTGLAFTPGLHATPITEGECGP